MQNYLFIMSLRLISKVNDLQIAKNAQNIN